MQKEKQTITEIYDTLAKNTQYTQFDHNEWEDMQVDTERNTISLWDKEGNEYQLSLNKVYAPK